MYSVRCTVYSVQCTAQYIPDLLWVRYKQYMFDENLSMCQVPCNLFITLHYTGCVCVYIMCLCVCLYVFECGWVLFCVFTFPLFVYSFWEQIERFLLRSPVPEPGNRLLQRTGCVPRAPGSRKPILKPFQTFEPFQTFQSFYTFPTFPSLPTLHIFPTFPFRAAWTKVW